MHSVQYKGRLTKILILILEGILKKTSYKRHVYESVDEKILYLKLCDEKQKKNTSCINGLKKLKFIKLFNPLVHSVQYKGRLTKILFLILEGILKKISYERRVYKSVDEKILSYTMSRKTTKKDLVY